MRKPIDLQGNDPPLHLMKNLQTPSFNTGGGCLFFIYHNKQAKAAFKIAIRQNSKI